jgi:hypothetical protein
MTLLRVSMYENSRLRLSPIALLPAQLLTGPSLLP